MIEADLRSWSKDVLEVPNPHLGGLPACPFARQAWREDKVIVVETDDLVRDGRKFCADFAGLGKDLVVVATYNIPDMDDLSALVAAMHAEFPHLHCMQFHPEYGAEDAELDFLTDNDWESDADSAYAMLFIQDLRLVVEASDRLAHLGYYNAYPHDEHDALVVQRKRRLTHGHEA
jgi:hypothetical protein